MARVRIKMCGLTQAIDLFVAAALGVDAIGLNFVTESPRFLSVAEAQKLVKQNLVFVDIVAVVVNPSVEKVQEILQKLPINYLQFHGEESPEFCRQFNKPYIKAIPVDSSATIDKYCEQYHDAAAMLLDKPSAQRGGSGQTFAWQLIPSEHKKPFILAGGLNITNVKAAAENCLPYAVDVSTGIESAPGIKDHEKMRQFVDALWGKV